MYTCPQCSLQIDDGFAPLPSKCPQCGTATAGTAPPPPSGHFDKPDNDRTATIFGMPPAAGAPPPPPKQRGGPPPAPGGPPMMDLPAPAADRNRPAELDLPAPAGFDMPAAELELEPASGSDALSLDLPSPVESGTKLGHDSFDLPAPAAQSPRNDLDLPAPAAPGNDFDLPAPARGNDFDLPAPAQARGGLELPVPPSGLEDLDLPAPAEDLPTPAEYLPAPAADLAPAGFAGLQLDIDKVGGDAPVPEARPGFGGDYAAGAGTPDRIEPVETGVPDVGSGAEDGANLVDAVEGLADDEGDADEATPSQPRALPSISGRQLSSDEVINHRASPAPKQLPLFTKKRLAIGGGIALLLAAGGGGAYMMGVFDDEPAPVVDRGEGTKPAAKPAGPTSERVEAILARFDEDTPQAYQQAQALLESQSDRVGQAEAELLLHYRYGPDPVLVGKARSLLEGYEAQPEPYVTRVFGLLLLADGKHAEAVAKLAGDDPRAALYRSWSALETGNAKQAFTEAQAALKSRPKSVGGALAKARASSILEEDGIGALAAIYEANAQHPRVIYTYASALVDDGNLAKAQTVADAFERAPSPVPAFQGSTLLLRSRIAREQGDLANAVRLLDQAKEVNPQNMAASVERISILLEQGDNSAARSEADILARDNPGNLDAGLLTAEVAIALGEGDLALARIDALGPEVGALPRVIRTRGRVFSMRMRIDEARAEFAKARAADPLDVEATTEEAQLLAKARQAPEGIVLVDKHIADIAAAAKDPAASAIATAALLRARAYLNKVQGDPAAAKEDLAKALETNPKDNHARLELARAQLALGERAQAEQTFLTLAERTTSFPGLTGPLGRIYLRRGELEQLEALIGDRLADERASDEVTLTGALLRLGQGRTDDAMKLADRVLLRNPASWEGHLARGQILFSRGEYDASLIEFEQSRPTVANSDVEFWLGRALEMTGEERKATRRFQKAVELEPGNVLAAAHLGRRYAMGGQSREAIKMLEPLVAETNEFPFAFAVLGRAYYDAGNRKKALTHLRKARRLDPKSFEAGYWEGRIEGDANNHSAAANALKAAVAAAPDSGPQVQDAWRRLGRAYKSLGRKGSAKEAFKKYLELAPAGASGRAEAERLLREL